MLRHPGPLKLPVPAPTSITSAMPAAAARTWRNPFFGTFLPTPRTVGPLSPKRSRSASRWLGSVGAKSSQSTPFGTFIILILLQSLDISWATRSLSTTTALPLRAATMTPHRSASICTTRRIGFLKRIEPTCSVITVGRRRRRACSTASRQAGYVRPCTCAASHPSIIEPNWRQVLKGATRGTGTLKRSRPFHPLSGTVRKGLVLRPSGDQPTMIGSKPRRS